VQHRAEDQPNAALATFRREDPLLDLGGPMPYPALQSAFDTGAAAAPAAAEPDRAPAVHDRAVRSWPLLVLALPAAVAV
jgi:hypothetical protein